MLLTKRDLEEFESVLELAENEALEEERLGPFAGYGGDEVFLTEWLLENPQVVMAGAGLQEYVGAHRLPIYRALIRQNFIAPMERPAFRTFEGQWLLAGQNSYDVVGYSIEQLRQAVRKNSDELFESSIRVLGTRQAILDKARKYLNDELLDATAFVSSRLWTPGTLEAEKNRIQSTALPLIQAIQSERVDLTSIHWRELEDIVAEVLRQSGMEVHRVESAPQGGRDIIARVTIAPGEVMTIAIEVKHRQFVDRPTLHTALHQNANFPALMLVTSGRFTAGILREAKRPENRLRLFLKDGVAIREMIREYPLSKTRP